MKIRFEVNDADTLERLAGLTPRQFMIAWSTVIKQHVQKSAREKIGGDFGDLIARHSILTDDSSEDRHEVYVGGENGYIAAHIHNGGEIKPKTAKFLAIPIDKSVKGMYPREYAGELIFLRKKEDGPNGRAYLAKPMKRKIKPLWVLKKSVFQKARPWFPANDELETVTRQFFENNF